jgi:hypothetical protein
MFAKIMLFLFYSQSMNFEQMIQTINKELSGECPETFNSSWISKRTPRCYRFIWKNVRTDFGEIDWDRVTCALKWEFQRRWAPARRKQAKLPYRNQREVKIILKKYQDKLYVFLSPQDLDDRRIRDFISIKLVRLAQCGNVSAKLELMKLVDYTIDDWIERYCLLSRWRGHKAEIQTYLERCIRRYRYSGSFLRYVFRTLELAARGIRPLQAYLDDAMIFNKTA